MFGKGGVKQAFKVATPIVIGTVPYTSVYQKPIVPLYATREDDPSVSYADIVDHGTLIESDEKTFKVLYAYYPNFSV